MAKISAMKAIIGNGKRRRRNVKSGNDSVMAKWQQWQQAAASKACGRHEWHVCHLARHCTHAHAPRTAST